MLSIIARLWDILGLVGPVILFAKLLVRELWISKLDWDEEPPRKIKKLWDKFQSELPELMTIEIPRHLGIEAKGVVRLVGFADASEKGYGASIYVHVEGQNRIAYRLLCSKSKVAPLKTLTLARLELCAILLLASLLSSVLEVYNPRIKVEEVLAFSDSQVALCWVHSSPHRWLTFVANRVAKIQEYFPKETFFHIAGQDNPSDCLSRGLTPKELINHPLWFKGPKWFEFGRADWPLKVFVPQSQSLPESKCVTLVGVNMNSEFLLHNLSLRFSSWTKLLRSIAIILKFCKLIPRGPITASDLEYAEMKLLMEVQLKYFSEEIFAIRKTKAEDLRPAIRKLCPVMQGNIIRVGGRLEHSGLDFQQKHPVLLPTQDHVVKLIVDHWHLRNCHTGPGLLTSLLRQKYWILNARKIARQRVRACNFCFRFRPLANYPKMADLPEYRVKETSKPFMHTG